MPQGKDSFKVISILLLILPLAKTKILYNLDVKRFIVNFLVEMCKRNHQQST